MMKYYVYINELIYMLNYCMINTEVFNFIVFVKSSLTRCFKI